MKFAVTSGRPPRGMEMLVEPLALELPLAAFNGGLFARPDMSVIEERSIDVGARRADHRADRRTRARRVALSRHRTGCCAIRTRRTSHKEADTVRFAPTVVESFDGLTEGIAKIVGVGDDLDARRQGRGGRAREVRRARLGRALAAVLPRRDPPRREQGRRRCTTSRASTRYRWSASRRSATSPTTC